MKAKLIQFFATKVLPFFKGVTAEQINPTPQHEVAAAKILGDLYGITPEQIAEAKQHVRIAEENFSKTADKWLFVKQGLQVLWPQIAASGINLAIELAVSSLKKKA